MTEDLPRNDLIKVAIEAINHNTIIFPNVCVFLGLPSFYVFVLYSDEIDITSWNTFFLVFVITLTVVIGCVFIVTFCPCGRPDDEGEQILRLILQICCCGCFVIIGLIAIIGYLVYNKSFFGEEATNKVALSLYLSPLLLFTIAFCFCFYLSMQEARMIDFD